MHQEVYDYKLKEYLARIIAELPINKRMQLKNLQLCGRKIAFTGNGVPSVYLASNGTSAKFFGTTMCKNPFACPCCSAHMMAGYSEQIGAALEAMREKGYFGFMVTFSVAHLPFMNCRDVTDILYETRSYFRRTAKQKYTRKHIGSVSQQFFADCEIKHSVTVCEYTYGRNGWHPHCHAILWCPRDKAERVLEWQDALNDFWTATAKRITLAKYANNEALTATVERLYEDSNDTGLYISQKDGKLSESLASEYICGWGADRELTGNYQKAASHDGHYTPYQILDMAYHGNESMKNIYLDFCLAVTKKPVHHRVMWSKTGLKAIAMHQMQIIRCREFVKKKQNATRWVVHAVFTKSQWYELLASIDASIVLEIATQGKEILLNFLEKHNIDYTPPEENYWTAHVEAILNKETPDDHRIYGSGRVA